MMEKWPESYWIPGEIRTAASVSMMQEKLINTRDDGVFHIGQSYDIQPAQTVVCCLCAGSTFYVGLGSYYTAIKCITCDWELNVHE